MVGIILFFSYKRISVLSNFSAQIMLKMFKMLNEVTLLINGWFERIEKIRAETIARFPRRESKSALRFHAPLFLLGFCAFIFFQTGLVVNIYNNRVLPPEVDDAYVYIGKAVQMEVCFFQDCPALETLRAQLSVPSTDLSSHGTSFLRDRATHRVLETYHPLHSALLFLIYKFTGSWEEAFRVFAVSGSVFLVLAIASWLRYLFGEAVTGISLILLSVLVFPGQGIAYIVPSNLTLGIFLMLWALILNPDNRYSEWIFLFGSVALLGMHTIGRLYLFILIFLYGYENKNALSIKKKSVLILAFLLILMTFLLPYFINRPLLTPFSGSFPDKYVRTVDGFKQELAVDIKTIKDSLSKLGDFKFIWLPFLLGALYFNKKNLWAFVVLTGLVIVSLVGTPGYPGAVFERVWIPMLILITGYVGQGYRLALLYAVGFFTRLKSDQLSKLKWFVLLGILCVLWVFGINLYNAGKSNMVVRQKFMEYVIARHDYWFDPKQTDFIRTRLSEQCGDIVYFSEEARGYFLSHGALSCGAIDFASVIHSPEETEWLVKNQNLNYAVFLNPIVKLSAAHNGGVVLNPGEKFLISSLDGSPIPGPIFFLFDNPGKRNELNAWPLSGTSNVIVRVVRPGNAEWIKVPSNGTSSMLISSTEPQNQIILRGIRVGNANSDLLWPWDQNIMFATLSYKMNETGSVNFELNSYKNLFPKASKYNLKVIMDNGDSILVAINR